MVSLDPGIMIYSISFIAILVLTIVINIFIYKWINKEEMDKSYKKAKIIFLISIISLIILFIIPLFAPGFNFLRIIQAPIFFLYYYFMPLFELSKFSFNVLFNLFHMFIRIMFIFSLIFYFKVKDSYKKRKALIYLSLIIILFALEFIIVILDRNLILYDFTM